MDLVGNLALMIEVARVVGSSSTPLPEFVGCAEGEAPGGTVSYGRLITLGGSVQSGNSPISLFG